MRTYQPLALPVAGSLFLAVLSGIVVPRTAGAEPISLLGEQSPAQESSFTLDFGVFGGRTSARIAQTQFALEIDADLGAARFEDYVQRVEPLTLPGGFNTGNIRVEIVPGSSDGNFNDLTGEFETDELYAIHFDGDLRAFNLTSPVILPSSSAGRVTVAAVNGGAVNLAWTGISELVNPFDPSSVIQFSYTCAVEAAFDPDPTSLVRLALMPDVLNLAAPAWLESQLMGKLTSALHYIETGGYRWAVRALETFVARVEAQRGAQLSDEVADMLTSDAEGAILLLTSEITGPREFRSPTPLRLQKD